MRKLAKVLLAGVAALSLTACGQAEGTTGSSADTTAKEQKQQETPEKIKIQSLNANGEEISLEVPYDPERIAVLDMAALDILDNLGVGDKIVGSASTSLEYLSDYVDNRLGGFVSEKQQEQERPKPDCPLIGQDGNIFNLMGIASRTLRKNGLSEQATEMCSRIQETAGSYSEALNMIGEYVNITSAEDSESVYEGMEMEL